MRIIFMGTPDFAVPTLNALVEAGHEVISVVAQPDRPKGRGKKMASPATVIRARELGIPVRQPRAVKKGPFVEWMCGAEADVAVVVAYGRILGKKLLEAPRHGCINVHGSLLPKYRGAAPIHWAVINGEKETGVTTMQMNEGMDTGDILLEKKMAISDQQTSGDLWMPMAEMGAELLVETLRDLEQIIPKKQDDGAASYAPMLRKENGKLDWSRSAEDLHNQIRGVNPWPGAWTTIQGKRLKIWKTKIREEVGTPGSIISVKKELVVATGKGSLSLEQIQMPGKKKGPAINLINGMRLEPGLMLGQE